MLPVLLLEGCSHLRLPTVRPYERTSLAASHARLAPSPLALAAVVRSQAWSEAAHGATQLPSPPRLEAQAELGYAYDNNDTRTVQGPALLVRRDFGRHYSASAEVSHEQVNDDSVDLLTLAGGPYHETRTRYAFDLGLRDGKSRYGVGYARHSADDAEGNTLRLVFSESLFGDLTRFTLAHERSKERYTRRGDASFTGDATRRSYQLAVSHLLTPHLLLGATFEADSAAGYLADPYRTVRYRDVATADGYARQPEQLPTLRSSDALALRAHYTLPWQAIAGLDYRYFKDNWGIHAHTTRATYVHYFGDALSVDANLRHYRQDRAYFQQDLYRQRNAQEFLSRDPALAQFSSLGGGLGVTWHFLRSRLGFVTGSTLHASIEHHRRRYDDYHDASRLGLALGSEPLYQSNTTLLQVSVSASF